MSARAGRGATAEATPDFIGSRGDWHGTPPRPGRAAEIALSGAGRALHGSRAGRSGAAAQSSSTVPSTVIATSLWPASNEGAPADFIAMSASARIR